MDPKVQALVNAARNLLQQREDTAATYEDAYDLVFKSWGREYWDTLTRAVDAICVPNCGAKDKRNARAS